MSQWSMDSAPSERYSLRRCLAAYSLLLQSRTRCAIFSLFRNWLSCFQPAYHLRLAANDTVIDPSVMEQHQAEQEVRNGRRGLNHLLESPAITLENI
ncbi:hypothetical protein OH77DRAFT_1425505 [Trametes cingulata]|nr:hypothetical protein OH77DRAFT_1425505 [Trametes cingulata]